MFTFDRCCSCHGTLCRLLDVRRVPPCKARWLQDGLPAQLLNRHRARGREEGLHRVGRHCMHLQGALPPL